MNTRMPLSPNQRAKLAGVAALVSDLLTDDDDARAAAETPPAAALATTDPATCEHPADQLIAAGRGGYPNAKVCRACGSDLLEGN